MSPDLVIQATQQITGPYHGIPGPRLHSSWTNVHEFVPISPKLIVVLRSFMLPNPEEDMKNWREKIYKLCTSTHANPAKIDYSRTAEEWMKPLVWGRESELVEIPASWYLDNMVPLMFIKNSANSHGWANPRDVEDL
jgi:hypothetical protein